MKKLLLVGGFSKNPSQYMYAHSFIQPLQRCGFSVASFNYRERYIPGAFARFNRLNSYIVNLFFLRKVLEVRPDIIFFVKAETIFHTTLQTIKKTYNPRLINFYPDSPFALWNGNATSDFIKSLHLFDQFLVWSVELIPAIVSAGCSTVTYFPFAYDESVFNEKIVMSNDECAAYKSDVCFVGTWEPERQWWLEQLCLKIPTIDLAIWGNDWFEKVGETSILKTRLKGRAIYGDTMKKVFKASKIVLNFIRQQNIQAHNMRTFEVPACKSFLLSQWTKDQAEHLFIEDESIVCFKTVDDLVEKINFYCSNDEARARITEHGFVKVQDFTLEKQLKRLFLI